MNAAAARESRTMLDKIWAEHTIVSQPGGEDLLYVDLNLVHEGGTFMREKLTNLGCDVVGNKPEELAAFFKNEMAKWSKVIKESGAKID